jgi:hypothetical protein
VSSYAGSLADAGWGEDHLVVVVFLMGVGIDAGVVADDGSFAEANLRAVVEQGALADDDAVFDAQVVAEVSSTPWSMRTPLPILAKRCRPNMQRKRMPSQ